MTLRLLAVGDLHLGRQPGGLPEALTTRLDTRQLGPAGALRRIVDVAIAREVDAVAFAGDLVEQEDDFFEAYGDLHAAVAALHGAGIAVVGIAGNHDVRVLPYLADEVEAFQLLGRDGTWDSVVLSGSDGVEAVLHGWSFPEARVAVSPLRDHVFSRDRRPALGLLHCDRDQSGSIHAPVTRAELAGAGLDGWLLGHIHKPDDLSPASPGGYLGSATALRRSETGPRGPWLWTIGAEGIRSIEHWPLAPLRWEPLEVSLDGIAEAEDARSRLLRVATETAGRIIEQQHRPEALGFRVEFTGRTDLRQAVASMLASEDLSDIAGVDGLHCFVGRYHFATLPELDLERLARRGDPAGLLAQRLLLLDEDPATPDRRDLLARARARLESAAREPAWQPLNPNEPGDDELAGWLREAAATALDELLAQHRETAA